MSSTLEQLKRQTEILTEDLNRERLLTSQACADLVDFCAKTPEPLNPKDPNYAKNPFRNKGPGPCTII